MIRAFRLLKASLLSRPRPPRSPAAATTFLWPFIGTWLAVAVLGLVAVVTYDATTTQVERTRWVEHTYLVLATLDDLRETVARTQAARHDYALTGDDDQLTAFSAATDGIDTAWRLVRALTSDNPSQQQRLARVEPILAEYRSVQGAAITRRKDEGFDLAREAAVAREVDAIVRRITLIVSDMATEERRLLAARQERMTRSVTRSNVVHAAGITVGAALFFLAFAGLRRENRRRRLTERLASAAEENLAMTLRCIGDAVIATDAAGRIVHMNPAAEKLTGCPGGAVGEALSGVFHLAPDGVHDYGIGAVARMLREEPMLESRTSHRVLVRKNGSGVAISKTSAAIRDRRGEIAGLVLVLRDETTEHQAERKLAESEDRLARLAEALPFGVIVLELQSEAPGDARVVYANTRSSAESRLDTKSFLGKTLKDVLPGDFSGEREPKFYAVLRRVVDTGESEVDETDRDGRGIVECHHVSLGGRTAAMIYSNVTEKRKAEAALRESEARFRQLADAMPQIVWAATPTGTLDYYNRGWTDYTGMTAEETFSRGWGPVIHPDDRKASAERWANALATGELHEYRYRFKRALDGSYRWHLGRALPIRDNDGRITKWIGTSTDIDDQIRADEALRVSEAARLEAAATRARNESEEKLRVSDERFRLLVQAVKDYALIMLDPTGRVTTWNEGAERIKGYDAIEIVGQHLSRFYSAEDVRDGLPEAQLQLAATHGRSEEEGWHVRKDGTHFFASVVMTAVTDREGKLVGFARVTRDVTERNLADSALKLANQELEAFSSSVAHDLRAPLRGMNGFAQVLLDHYKDKLDAEGQDWLREILLNARKMGELIDALLSLARVARSEIRPERVDVSAVARAAATDAARAETRRAVEFTIEPDLRAEVDPRLVRTVFDNLIGNAWKFTRDVPTARIDVGLVRTSTPPAFFVRDNGAGFDMDFIDKLFSPFHRLHTADEFPGTGIGLSTVQRIIHRHGGRIWAEGVVGGGATVYFTLPGMLS